MGTPMKFVTLSVAALTVAAVSTFSALHAAPAAAGAQQGERPKVAPPGREDIYRRAWQISSLIKGGVITPRWMADGNSFWYAEGAPDHTVIYRFDPTSRAKTPLFDAARLRGALVPVLGHELPYRGLPFDTFAFLDQERSVKFAVDGDEYVMSMATYAISKVTPPSRQERARSEPRVVRVDPVGPITSEILSPDGRWLLGEKDSNLYVRSTYDGREVPLTTDGVEYYDWRIGHIGNNRTSSAKWSRDSSQVGVLKRDDREVWKLPIMNQLKQNDEVFFHPWTKAGGRQGLTELYVIDIRSGTKVKAQIPDDHDRYIIMIGWLPDGSELLFNLMNRDFKKLQILAMNPVTGAVRTVVEETQPTFIKGLNRFPAWDRGLFTLIDGGKQFIFISERDGWDHLYLYTIDGTLVRRLTTGEFPVLQVQAVDMKGRWVYFTAHAEPQLYDTHIYRVGLDGKGFARLTEGEGLHAAVFSPSMAYFVDSHSSFTQPPTVDVRTTDGKQALTLAKADVSDLTALGFKPPEEFIIKAADGKTDLYGVIYKPHDFDPAKKYPVVENIYAGPLVPWVTRGYFRGRAAYSQSLAELGFVVVLLDGRGSTDRGKAFQDVVYGNFGKHEIPEHAAGLRQLGATRPYMDMSRVGVVGGSCGGYFTIRALLTAPDVYHVGVAYAPVVTLEDNFGPTIEPYMNLPQNNRAGYEYGSLLPLAGNLKGQLLIIHGTWDLDANFSGTMKMSEAFIRAGTFFDLIVMPGIQHGPHGLSMQYWYDAEAKYLVEHLLHAKAPSGTAQAAR
ncbi:MAG: DPP IV N-terminal domain-containing protein [Planctomycetes bacterium]|nr:DPP IV N-terminal domain-containing protein [Planctomycetota bacterium]